MDSLCRNGVCECRVGGYEFDGRRCHDKNECLNMHENNCHQNAECQNLDGGFLCICQEWIEKKCLTGENKFRHKLLKFFVYSLQVSEKVVLEKKQNLYI